MSRAKREARPHIDVRSTVGIDAGLASFACAHVERRNPDFYALISGRVYVPPSRTPEPTVAEDNAVRTADLLRWLRPVLGQAVADGAESFIAERYEHVQRSASAATKHAAGHAVLVAASMLCEPRPRLQAAGYGGPAYVSGRDAKRAVTGCDVATKAVVIAAARRLVAGAGEALRTLLAEQRPHLADAVAVALCALGHRERVAMVGESPLGTTSPLPFAGPSFMKLREAAGGDAAMGAFALTNLIPEPRSFEGSRTERIRPAFPMREAKARALDLELSLDGRAVILVGERLARAFGLQILGGEDALCWHEVRSGGVAFMAAMLPHPSGVNRWWNEPGNVARARTFLRAAARVA